MMPRLCLAFLLLLTLAALSRAADEGEHDHDHGAHAAEAEDPAEHEAPVGAERPGWTRPVLLLLCLTSGAAGLAGFGRPPRLAARWVAGLAAAAAFGVWWATGPAGADLEPLEAHDDAHEEASSIVEVDAETLAELGLATEVVRPPEPFGGLRATGRILPVESREAHLAPRVAGRLAGVHVKVGDRVAAGETVATLDSVDAAQAAAALREAAARQAAAEGYLSTRRDLAASGSYSTAPLEAARRELAMARVARAAAESELAQAGNELGAATAELDRVERLAAAGSYTSAAVEEARRELAEAEAALTAARAGVAEAEAEATAAEGLVAQAEGRETAASSIAEQTSGLVATGELDRAPLEAAQGHLAEAEARRVQAREAVDQARRLAERGEELYRSELIALAELEARRSALRDRQAQLAEAEVAVTHATTALRRQERIAEARMTGGRAETEARNAVAAARAELTAARAASAKARSRVAVAASGVGPAEAAVEAAGARLRREEAIAGDGTRAAAALAEARLRGAQASRLQDGKQAEVAEHRRLVATCEAALAREEHLAAGRVRAREMLLEAEREVTAARIERANATEMLRLLGAAGGRSGRVIIPLRSPFGGVVAALDAAVGEPVGPESAVATVLDLSEVYVEADVSEHDLPRVIEGQPVLVRVRAYGGETFAGAVVSLGGGLDPETRAAHVRARLDNRDGRLRPEMFATVEFGAAPTEAAVTVPAEAVHVLGDGPTVYLERAPGRYEARPVALGREADGRVEVVDGLSPGDVVVTTGGYLLRSQQSRGELGHGHAH